MGDPVITSVKPLTGNRFSFADENFANCSPMKKIALYSGKFHPTTLSHVVTVLRLLREFETVKVVMLDYPERVWPLCYCCFAFDETFDLLTHTGFDRNRVQVMTHPAHFARITAEELKIFEPWDEYIAGNMTCLRHIEQIAPHKKVSYRERSLSFQASDVSLPKDE